jgi:hypothetical protein
MTEAEVAEKIMAAFPRMKELRQARDEFSPFDYEIRGLLSSSRWTPMSQ